jgi:hypothetical protein
MPGTRQCHAIKLAAVGGGEDELLVAGIPGYDAVFVVVILRGFAEELGDLFDCSVVGGAVIIDASLFCNKVNAHDIRSSYIYLELPCISKIDSLESDHACIFRSAPLERVERGVGMQEDLCRAHAGPQAVHVEGFGGLGGCRPANKHSGYDDESFFEYHILFQTSGDFSTL